MRQKRPRGQERQDWERFNPDCEVCQQKSKAMRHMRVRLSWWRTRYLKEARRASVFKQRLTDVQAKRKDAWLAGYKAGKEDA